MIELPREQVEALLSYLMERPAKEVISAVLWLQQALEADDSSSETSTDS